MSGPAELRIRSARPQQRQELEDLQRRSSLANETHRAALEANPDAIHLPLRQIAVGDVFVAELAGRLAGFAALIDESDYVELDGLFVEPDHWRLGIGRALVSEAIHRARRQGLTLMVIAGPEVRGFYQRCGFGVEGEAATRFGPALRMSR